MTQELLLTDWISCTTPPVREGEYDLTYVGKRSIMAMATCREVYSNGAWNDSPGINGWEHCWVWRGMRRWVLVRDTKRKVKFYHSDIVNGVKLLGFLQAAMSFDTAGDAVLYAVENNLKNFAAVLP